MSSMQRSNSGQGSSTFELGSKKKFGKNLNKLQKPPPPPISNGANKGAGASRNGLLLLSTKRSSSTGNSQGSGLLSSKPVPTASTNSKPTTQPLAIRHETYASTHDALVDAVMGASRNDPQKEPDAWGAAEKQAYADETPKAAATEGDSTTERQIKELPVYNENDFDRGYQPNKNNLQQHGDRQEGFEGRRYSRNESDESKRRSESDDNWRRSEEGAGAGGDEQGSYMTRLARERAERRREEEEARMNEQRERARQRLLALEQKMETTSTIEPAHLENQGRKNDAPTNGGKTRTLFDPNKPYSSLVGGNTQTGDHPTPEPSPSKPATNRTAEAAAAQPDGPVIHISNYEDRDRGERNGTAGPRMLFDPKSGSMVAVTDNSKNKKAKPKGRRDADKSDSGEALTNGKKKGKGRNEPARKDRRRGDSVELASADETKNGKSRKARPPVNRLPRTCGVLYVRDEKGACYSADGCEGDQGYGCHGVPGGRIRNPSDFAKFQEEQQKLVPESGSQEDYGEFGVEDEQEQMLQGYSAPQKTPIQEPIIDWVKRNEKIELLTGDEDSPTLRSTATAWRPSQAALTAALEMKTNQEQTSNMSVESVLGASADEEDDDGDDPDAYIGLGFDPSNMDSVMSSPSVRAHATRLDAVDLSSLTLGVPASDTKSDSKNIFAFGSSSTWGSTGGSKAPGDAFSTSSTWGSTSNHAGSGNWGVLGGASALGAVTESQDKAVAATSFLSLSSTNTWGTTGLFGSDHGTTADR